MNDDRIRVRELQLRAAIASPAACAGEHLDVASLARLRKGDEDEALDAGYRHVASCAVCRARLTDAAPGEALVEAALPVAQTTPKLALVSAPRKSTRTLGWILAAAATLGLVAALLARGPRNDPALVVTQRSFVGTMGTAASTAAVPDADRNLELTLESEAEAAAVVVCDASSGRRIHGAQPFTRDARGKLVVVLAPRLFGPTSDPALAPNAWVFAGKDAAVQRVLRALPPEVAFVEAHVRAVASAEEVRLAITPIAR